MSTYIFTLSLWSFLLSRELGVTIRVTVKQGILDGGVEYKSRNGTYYYGFLGVPFAKPPVGELRFEAPQEPDPWEGVRNAKEQPPYCSQTHRYFPDTKTIAHGQEDCLYLNVYTPNVNTSELFPVMVFVYGGAFTIGAAFMHEPEYLMDHSIVFVPIQHRHAIFGFLSTGDEILPGNYGMKDQVAALKWVQQNIAAFGGDPNRVTMSGYSSGAISAHFLMHSPLSSGLFQRALCLSGTAHVMDLIVPRETARERARALGTLAGCHNLESQELKKCLKKVPAHELALDLSKFFVLDAFPKYPFGIVVEPETMPGAFLVKDPWQQNVINRVPLFIGFNTDEGCLFASRLLRIPSIMAELNAHPERLFPLFFHYANRMIDPKSSSAITTLVKKFYFDNEEIRDDNAEKLIILLSDSAYDFGSMEAVRRYFNEQKEAPIYLYHYGHQCNYSLSQVWLNSTRNLGVCHADETLVLFPKRKLFSNMTDEDLDVSKRMIKYIANFMYYGDPNGEASEKIWLPVQSSNFEYLNILTEVDVMAANLRTNRYNFWRNIFASTIPEYFNGRLDHIKTEL